MIYLKSNSSGRYQPHQCAKGADITITAYGKATVNEVVQLANATCIAYPFSDDLPAVPFSALGRGKFVNLYYKA